MRAATEIYPVGKDDSPVIASSAIKNVLAILNDSGLRTHAPGPKGLPGGWLLLTVSSSTRRSQRDRVSVAGVR
ncbi:MAG TPA: hypothetical protein GX507_05495 [Clostridia bacterium]|nr:hypothetical protein [Clostridia bacterium]